MQGIVLLKNVNGNLPWIVSNRKNLPIRISLFGVAACPDPNGANCEDDIRCSGGALGSGWGSGAVSVPYLTTPFKAITSRDVRAHWIVNTYFHPGDVSVLDTAINNAKHSDLNIIFGLTNSGKGYLEVDGNAGDRKKATLLHVVEPTIAEVASLNTDNIVVISTV